MVNITTFKKMALEFEEAEEQPHFEKTSFRVHKKIFATLNESIKTVVLKFSEIEQSVFSAFDKTIIYPVNGVWGKQGWTIIELSKVKKEVLKDALAKSYDNVAPKKLAKNDKNKSMAKVVKADSELVTEYIKALKPEYREIAEATRKLILKTNKDISEQIKWNVPAFYYSGEMKHFDPKEYKRDIIVTHFRQKDHVLLILPNGSKLNNGSDILEGHYKDGRRMIKIYDLKDLKAKEKELKKIIKEWITLIDK